MQIQYPHWLNVRSVVMNGVIPIHERVPCSDIRRDNVYISANCRRISVFKIHGQNTPKGIIDHKRIEWSV